MSWLKLVGDFGQSLPLLLVSFCRNQQAKLAGNAEKQQQMLQKIFCLTTENFPTKICKKSDEILTYLKNVKVLKSS
jgi:hypothetical protein